MNNTSFYKYSTWGLLLLNLAMLAFFFLTKPPGSPRGDRGAGKEAFEQLQLDETQRDSFFVFADRHRARMDAINKQQRTLLKPYFYTLLDGSSPVDSLITLEKIAQLERQKIELTYQHFQEVKTMLTVSQQAQFPAFMNFALERILLGDEQQREHPRRK